VSTLEDLLTETELRAVRGRKVVEVRTAWAGKWEVVSRVHALWPADFVMGVGDDRTDEELFEHLPAGGWTIYVGEGPSRARFRLESPTAVRGLLSQMSEAASG
jgi:trehalose 6-phosphate synthase/phosphatase